MNYAWKWIVFLSFVTLATAAGPSLNLTCLAKSCFPEVAACTHNKYCLNLLECQEGCYRKWDTDQTPQKIEVQKCTSVCQFSYLYNQKVSNDFLFCAIARNCVSIADIPSTCSKTAKGSQDLSAEDLVGDWWVVRGYNKAYDCYDCTRFGFKSYPGSSLIEYTASFRVPLANGTEATISQKFALSSSPGEPIRFGNAYGSDISIQNTWYLLDKAVDGSYVLVYYCGNGLTWNYEGAVVLSRTPRLPETAYSRIATVYKTTVGIQFDEFCTTKVEECGVN